MVLGMLNDTSIIKGQRQGRSNRNLPNDHKQVVQKDADARGLRQRPPRDEDPQGDQPDSAQLRARAVNKTRLHASMPSSRTLLRRPNIRQISKLIRIVRQRVSDRRSLRYHGIPPSQRCGGCHAKGRRPEDVHRRNYASHTRAWNGILLLEGVPINGSNSLNKLESICKNRGNDGQSED